MQSVRARKGDRSDDDRGKDEDEAGDYKENLAGAGGVRDKKFRAAAEQIE
jgi:hypothetical protein